MKIVDTYTVGAAAISQFQVLKTPAAAVVSAADTDVCFGVAQDGAGAGEECAVCTFGPTQAIAGAAFAKGIRLAPDANGRVKAAAVGDLVIGFSRTAAGAAGDIVQIVFLPSTSNVLA